MRFLVFTLFCIFSLSSFSQEIDTTRKSKSKRLPLTKYPKPETPPKKSAYVVITSDKKAPSANDTWDDEWTAYIEDQARTIGGKVLARDGDSVKITYKVMIDFSVNDDGSVKELQVSCVPAHNFIVAECTKMALNGPKRKSIYYKGKYVRMHVKQPVDIKVR